MDRGKGYNRVARKLVHIAGCLPAFALPYVPFWLALTGSLIGMVFAYTLKPSHAWWLRSITKPIDRHRGVITGLRGYFTAAFVLILIWPLIGLLRGDQAVYYVIFGWLALAWGDGLAGIIGPGPSVGRTVPWNKQKTWWGVVGCTLGCAFAYITAFWLLPGRPEIAPAMLFGTTLATAVLVAVLESIDFPFDDNYSVGLGAPLLALALHALLAW
jgi:dolichol kinase